MATLERHDWDEIEEQTGTQNHSIMSYGHVDIGRSMRITNDEVYIKFSDGWVEMEALVTFLEDNIDG